MMNYKQIATARQNQSAVTLTTLLTCVHINSVNYLHPVLSTCLSEQNYFTSAYNDTNPLKGIAVNWLNFAIQV